MTTAKQIISEETNDEVNEEANDEVNEEANDEVNEETNDEANEETNKMHEIFKQTAQLAKEGKFKQILKYCCQQYKGDESNEELFALRKAIADMMIKNNMVSDGVELYKKNYENFKNKVGHDDEQVLLLKLQYKIIERRLYDVALCFVETEMSFTNEENKTYANSMKETFMKELETENKIKKFKNLMSRARKNLNKRIGNKSGNHNKKSKSHNVSDSEIEKIMDEFNLHD